MLAGVGLAGAGVYLGWRATKGEEDQGVDPGLVQEDRGSVILRDAAGSVLWKPIGIATPVPVANGERLYAEFRWVNVGDSPLAPRFRLDIRRKFGDWGSVTTWSEGRFTVSELVQPGATSTMRVQSIQIPSDWKDWDPLLGNQTIDVRLFLDGAAHEDWWMLGEDMLQLTKQEYGELHCLYDDSSLDGSPVIVKGDGDPFWGAMTFRHKGPPEVVDVYLGLNCGGRLVWTQKRSVSVGRDADWADYSVELPTAYVDGTNISSGDTIESKKIVAPTGVSPRWDAKGARLSDPDWPYRYVAVTEHEFSNLLARYDGNPIGTTGIEKMEGDVWYADVVFQHRGPAVTIDVGVGLSMGGVGCWAIARGVGLQEDLNWAEYSLRVEGTFNTGGRVSVGAEVQALKALQTQGGSFNIGGSGMLLTDWDWAYKFVGGEPETVSFLAFLGPNSIAFARATVGADYWRFGWFDGVGWEWGNSAPLDYGVYRIGPMSSSFYVRLGVFSGDKEVDTYVSPKCGPADVWEGAQLWINNIPGCWFNVV